MPNEINQDTNIDTVRDAPKTTKPVVQSPATTANDASVDHLANMVEDNADSRARDAEMPETESDYLAERAAERNDPIKAAVTGANAGADNQPIPARARGKGKRVTGFNDEVAPQDPNVGGAPLKLDSFGRPGDSPQPRPGLTPDLAEPLRDPANASGQGTMDAGETTARLHSAFRATGARQYGILDDPDQDASGPTSDYGVGSRSVSSSGAVSLSSGLGEVSDPHHAISLVKSKITELHQIVHNIGNVASVPVHAIESLVAEIQYLMGVVRSKA
jgi:hypothetical protein